MSEQGMLLVAIVSALVFTLGMYIWRAVKQIKNKNDERWNLVLLKAKSITEIPYWILIAAVGVISIQHRVTEQMITISINRVLICILVFWGIRNLVEWIGLIYFERNL